MALTRTLSRVVKLRGQFIEEVGPVAVAPLSLLLAEPDYHQVLLGRDVDVLPVVALRREVIFTFRRVDPPEVLVILGRVRARIRPRRLLDPLPRDELSALPTSFLGEQHAEPSEVARPRVDPALHLLETILVAIQAPGAVRLHTHRPPQLRLHEVGDGHTRGPLEYHPHQQG